MSDYAPPAEGVTTPPAKTCECGCGTPVARRFVSGHNRRGQATSPEHRARIGAAQAIAWATKRERKPLGSRRLDANGYWLIKVREGGGRWDKEHVFVAQGELGRKLRLGEHVHHINGVKTDNRPENLHVCTESEHAKAHGSFAALLPSLIADGSVVFDRETGRYRRG